MKESLQETADFTIIPTEPFPEFSEVHVRRTIDRFIGDLQADKEEIFGKARLDFFECASKRRVDNPIGLAINIATKRCMDAFREAKRHKVIITDDIGKLIDVHQRDPTSQFCKISVKI